MRLSEHELYLLGQCAISAACQAGHLIAGYERRGVAVDSKHGVTSLAAQVVTEVDHLSQDLILATLQPACRYFDLAWLSEESPDDRARLDKDFFWSIDPLDGTLPYIEGLAGYSVAIALVARDGTAVIGVVYDPVTQTLYHALLGQGVWRNRQAIVAAATPSTEQNLIFVTDRSFAQDPRYSATLAGLECIALDLGYGGATLRLQGGAAMNACQVLDGTAACYFKPPKPQPGGGSVWDYAATACLFREAGGHVSDMSGAPLRLNPSGSTFMNHCGVLYCAEPRLAARMVTLDQQLPRAC